MVYSRGKIAIIESNGNVTHFPAANNAQRSSKGAWEAGSYEFAYWVPHSGDGPDSSYGSNGNFVFEYEGRSGMGIHSGRENRCDLAGRCGVNYATNGCIRTTDEATELLKHLHENGDPLTKLSRLPDVGMPPNDPDDHIF